MATEGFIYSVDDVHKLSYIVHDHFDSSNSPLKYKITDCGKRSIPQNSTFHGWCGETADYLKKHMPEFIWCGKQFRDMSKSESLEAVKEILKHTHLGYEQKTRHDVVTGEIKVVEELRHTSGLDKGEMFHFMTKCERMLLGWGVPITIPIASEYRQIMERQDQ